MTPDELRAVREALGLSQKALARRLGLSQSTVNRWERGLTKIDHAELVRLAMERLALERT